jgi:hypothetical protein
MLMNEKYLHDYLREISSLKEIPIEIIDSIGLAGLR